MPVDIEPVGTRTTLPRTSVGQHGRPAAIRIGLINNMPDTALHATEAQFAGLLEGASSGWQVALRFSCLPELARGPEAAAHIQAGYWPLGTLLAEGLDALIVTGTEPRSPVLSEEPYWGRLAELLAWARQHTVTSVWSCLAAHAAVELMDGIRRQRLPEKRCGVYPHLLVSEHALLSGVAAPLKMPHSRWNELPLAALERAGYTILSASEVSGADAFIAERESLLVFFQGHPEYQATTLLREYRRDVGRYLNGQQAHYPTLPHGYLSGEASARLETFKAEAVARRDGALIEQFPFAA
ncbi:MAG TPA: homoserine O-succinyltransferase, partial [Steroidobacteraceae bacterium]|nr:homoserine O-succinyltransferase [Steroidobacteraceae bacterium]